MSNSTTDQNVNPLTVNLSEFLSSDVTKVEGSNLGWRIREKSDIDTRLDQLLDNGEMVKISIKLPDQVQEVDSEFLKTFLNYAIHMLGNGPLFKTISFETNNPSCNALDPFKKAVVSTLGSNQPVLTKKQMNDRFGCL
jgi:hypothetical protein